VNAVEAGWRALARVRWEQAVGLQEERVSVYLWRVFGRGEASDRYPAGLVLT